MHGTCIKIKMKFTCNKWTVSVIGYDFYGLEYTNITY